MRNIAFIEPTLGLPASPILLSQLCRRGRIDALVALTTREVDIELRRLITSTTAVPVLNLIEFVEANHMISNQQFHALIELSRAESLKLCPSRESLHHAAYEGAPIGIFVASYLCRHNLSLCETWKPQLQEIINTMTTWITYAKIIKTISNKHTVKFAQFTHDVYFWGFIAEYTSRLRVKTLIYGATKYPISPIKGQYISIYKKKTATVSLPLSAHEIAKSGGLEFCKRDLTLSIQRRTRPEDLDKTAKQYYNQFFNAFEGSAVKSLHELDRIALSQSNSGQYIFALFLHSFADNLFSWGYEGFNNLIEYYHEVTRLIFEYYPEAMIIIRPHPDIFRKERNDRVHMDLELTRRLIHKLASDFKRIYVCHPSISIEELLSYSKKCIAVTHHSNNVARECLYLRRHCIASENAIMVMLKSPVHHNFSSRDALGMIFRDGVFCSDPESLVDVDEAVAGSKLATFIALYDPTYSSKKPKRNSCSDPDFCLVAGFSNLHTEYSPSCTEKITSYSISDIESYDSFIASSYGKIALHALKKYCAQIIETYFSD